MEAEMNKNKDIAFSSLYRRLLTTNRSENSISLLLHADGISLTGSTKLKLCMLSGALVETVASSTGNDQKPSEATVLTVSILCVRTR